MNTPKNKPEEKSPEPKVTLQDKWLDFASGFLGWYLVNGLIWLLFSIEIFGLDQSTLILNILTLPLNVIALLIFAFTPSARFVALGLLGALAVNFVISLVIGLQFNAMCFIPFFIQ